MVLLKSRRKVHPQQQILEARVVAEGAVGNFYISPSGTVIVFVNGFG